MFVTTLWYRTWLIKIIILFIFMNRGVILNEIGEKLREAREGHGVSIEEAADAGRF